MQPADLSHPSVEELEGLMRGELKRLAVSVLVRHLLSGCPRCVAVTRRLWNLGELPLGGFDATLAAELDEDRPERRQRKVRAV
jgi:hypothetical protein